MRATTITPTKSLPTTTDADERIYGTMTNDESAADQPIRWRPRRGLICCSIRPIPLPTLGQHRINTSVAHWTEGIAHPGRFALQRLRRGDRHLSFSSPPSYRRPLLESQQPSTPPSRTKTQQRQCEQGGESICKLIIAFWVGK